MRIAIIASVLFLAASAQARDAVPVCAPASAGHARCHALIAVGHDGITLSSPRSPVGGFGPADLRSAYKITGVGSSPTIVAAVAAYGYDNAEADLAVYRAQFGLPACTTANGCFKKLNQRGKQGNYPAQNVGWAEESALDLDMASAMCPRCRIWLVEADTATIKDLAASEDTAAKLGAHAISNSYGAPDSADTLAHEGSYNHPGIAITASVGDSGFGGGTQFPASSPHVTAVGGTHLARDSSLRGWSETAWTVGGCTTYAKPAWQTDTGCGTHRTVADVAAVADPNTGVAVYGPVSGSASGWMVFGGTSVSAPIIAGVYGVNGGTVTYGSNPYAHTGALFDIVSGGGGGCTPSYLCMAGPGYDGPTGMGTPNGIVAFGEP
jgi:hypothetical protein